MKFIKTTNQNIRRSPYQAIAAIVIMMLTFLVVSFFIFLIAGSSKIVSYFESKPQVTAFFKNEAKQSDIDALQSNLKDSGKVSNVKFVSKQDALAIYKEQNKNDPLLLDLVTADILPSSLEISTYKIGDLSAVSETLKTSPIVSEVIFQKDVVATLTAWTSALRKIGAASILILSLVSIFLIITIIGIKISQKRQDIHIMGLIGATNWYIRWPFIFEGIFYGVVGAFAGWVISSASLWAATPFLSNFLRGIPVVPVSPLFLLELLFVELIMAVILGGLAAYLAVLRYLK
ncbi:MAG TPA: permease-like cell division protein FtsX [Patescibacteria group bacterium]|nr:permease-like cell division protein FtsX [Patescibacteria group bacterium]